MADLEKKEEKSRQWKPYSCSELSAFCLQVSLLLEAAVPLDEGFSIMAEDAADEKERQMLLYMSEGAVSYTHLRARRQRQMCIRDRVPWIR